MVGERIMWAADLRTYLAPPVQDDHNPFDGDAA